MSLKSKKQITLDVSQHLYSRGSVLPVGAILTGSLHSPGVTQPFSEVLGWLSLVPCYTETSWSLGPKL